MTNPLHQLVPAVLNPAQIHQLVIDVQQAYSQIEHKAWNGQSYSKGECQMWIEASEIVPLAWREIIRVLAQGGEYYSIQWPAPVAPEVLRAEAKRIQGLIEKSKT